MNKKTVYLLIALLAGIILITVFVKNRASNEYSGTIGSSGGNEYSGTIGGNGGSHPGYGQQSSGGNEYSGTIGGNGGSHPGYGQQSSGGNEYSGTIGGGGNTHTGTIPQQPQKQTLDEFCRGKFICDVWNYKG